MREHRRTQRDATWLQQLLREPRVVADRREVLVGLRARAEPVGALGCDLQLVECPLAIAGESLDARELVVEDRQVLLLRFFEGLSAEETGQRLARTAGAVRKLTARALVELGRQL